MRGLLVSCCYAQQETAGFNRSGSCRILYTFSKLGMPLPATVDATSLI